MPWNDSVPNPFCNRWGRGQSAAKQFAVGGVGINKLQNCFAKRVVFLYKQMCFLIQIIDSELAGCETVLQQIDPNPAVCKMDLGLIGSMARSSHELSSFVYTHQACMHLPNPIHTSRPLIGRNRQKRITHGVSWKCKQSKTAADRRTGVLGDAGC